MSELEKETRQPTDKAAADGASTTKECSTSEKTRKYTMIEASKLHPSRILPEREVDENQVDVIRRQGIQHPIIVRESPSEPGKYEIIDGHTRFRAVQGNQLALVDIRYADDAEVFRISEGTFTRKARTTYERALCYCNWVKAMTSKYGETGAQGRVARAAYLSEANVSYYISIGKLFERLTACKVSDETFNALKTQSMNKLSALAQTEFDVALVKAADRIAKFPDLTLKQVKQIISEEDHAAHPAAELEKDENETERDKQVANERVKEATQQLENILEEARKTLSALKTHVDRNPDAFSSSEVYQKIAKILKALKRVGKEASQIINPNLAHQ